MHRTPGSPVKGSRGQQQLKPKEEGTPRGCFFFAEYQNLPDWGKSK